MTWWPRSVWFLMAVGLNTSPTEALWPAGEPCTQSEAALCAHIINKDGFDYKSDEVVALSSLNMKSHKSGGGFLMWCPVALETGHINFTTGVRSYTEVWAVCEICEDCYRSKPLTAYSPTLTADCLLYGAESCIQPLILLIYSWGNTEHALDCKGNTLKASSVFSLCCPTNDMNRYPHSLILNTGRCYLLTGNSHMELQLYCKHQFNQNKNNKVVTLKNSGSVGWVLCSDQTCDVSMHSAQFDLLLRFRLRALNERASVFLLMSCWSIGNTGQLIRIANQD